MTRKVYDIVITEGEDKGCCRMAGIYDKNTAEMLKSRYFEPSCEIVEREEEITEEELEFWS